MYQTNSPMYHTNSPMHQTISPMYHYLGHIKGWQSNKGAVCLHHTFHIGSCGVYSAFPRPLSRAQGLPHLRPSERPMLLLAQLRCGHQRMAHPVQKDLAPSVAMPTWQHLRLLQYYYTSVMFKYYILYWKFNVILKIFITQLISK